MEATFVNERYDGLLKSVNKALNEMKTDGLALILQNHPASVEFASKRLYEVLSEVLTRERELIINELSNDLLKAEKKRETLGNKLTKCTDLARKATNKVNTDREELMNRKEAILNSFEEENSKLRLLERNNNRILKDVTNRSVIAEEKTQDIQETCDELKRELLAIKSSFKKQHNECMQATEKAHRALFNLATNIVYSSSSNEDDPYNYEINQKVEMLNSIKNRNRQLKDSLTKIKKVINNEALNEGVEDLDELNEKEGNLRKIIQETVKQAENNELDRHFRQASSNIPKEVNCQPEGFVDSVAELYHKKLLEKEKQYDKTINEAIQRRELLKQRLKEALEHLNDVQMANYNYDEIAELQKKSNKVESSRLVLDEMCSKLGLPHN